MNDTQINTLLQQLMAAKLAAQSFAVQADILYEQFTQALREASQERAIDQESSLEGEGCRHPPNLRDLSARTMGNPNRFLCRLCGKVVDG